MPASGKLDALEKGHALSTPPIPLEIRRCGQ